jgi:hypothetical protein
MLLESYYFTQSFQYLTEILPAKTGASVRGVTYRLTLRLAVFAILYCGATIDESQVIRAQARETELGAVTASWRRSGYTLRRTYNAWF